MTRTHRFVVVAVCWLAALVGCGADNPETKTPLKDGGTESSTDAVAVDVGADVSPDALSPALQKFANGLESNVPSLLTSHGVPGAAIVLVEGGKPVWARGFGFADVESGIPVDPAKTVFQVASISKSVTAWGVMSLVEQGKLDLDKSVETYLTRWHLPQSAFDHNGVTIRRVLSHTAGLSLHGYPGFPPEQTLPTLEESLDGATNGAGSVFVQWEPGSEYHYSGGGFTILQLIIEEVTGQSFSEFMADGVLSPLGMSSSSFEWLAGLQPRTATAYKSLTEPLPNYLFTAKAAAGLYTTAEDLAIFASAGLHGPHGDPGRDVLSEDSVHLLHKPVTDDVKYGLGHRLDGTMVGHDGDNHGWKGAFYVVPAHDVGIVVLTNGDTGKDLWMTIIKDWHGEYVGSLDNP